MRRRSREINIFNMSLLDILCGALGAFCFMMLVLMPYYKPPGQEVDAQKKQQEIQDALKKLEEMKNHLTEADAAKELEELVKKLEAQIQELQGRVNQALAEAEQLKKELESTKRQLKDALAKVDELDRSLAENQQLKQQMQQLQRDRDQALAENQQIRAEKEQLLARNQKLEEENARLLKDNKDMESRLRSLHQRQPVLVKATAEEEHEDLSLYVYHPFSYRQTDGGTRMVTLDFNPDGAHQRPSCPGDLSTWFDGRGGSVWMIRDIAPHTQMKVYAQISSQSKSIQPTRVRINTEQSSHGSNQFPAVALTPEHPWVYVGDILASPDEPVVLRPATPEEREQEWKKPGSANHAEAPEPHQQTAEERKNEVERISAARAKVKADLKARIAELEANPPKDREGAIRQQKELSDLKAKLEAMEGTGLSHPK